MTTKSRVQLRTEKIESGRYRVTYGTLRFEVSSVKGGWTLMGLGDASADLLQAGGVSGGLLGGSSRKECLRRLTEIIDTPRKVSPPRQEVCWVGPDRIVALEQKPKRVWTIIPQTELDPSPERPPELPIVPVHNRNAFLEDQTHDWLWQNGKLRYYSRVARDSVWILCEFEVKS